MIENSVKKFNKENGNQEISTKKLVIYFHSLQEKKIGVIFDKIDDLSKQIQEYRAIGMDMDSEQNRAIQHIIDDLPEKGFCAKTQNIINCWHPDVKEPPLDIKVQRLWYDRKFLKFLVGALITSTLIMAGSIVVNILT